MIEISINNAVSKRINQMINFKPKHFTKLEYNNELLHKIYKLYPNYSKNLIRSKLEIIFWTRFEENEIDKFNIYLMDIVEHNENIFEKHSKYY